MNSLVKLIFAFCLQWLLFLDGAVNAQIDSSTIKLDSMMIHLDEIVISSSRIPERILRSPISIDQLNYKDVKNMGAPSFYDALINVKGVQVTTPSLGFKVINTRGFGNTTNVRFVQLIDGVDNQAPHIGAPIGNALGANELDIYAIEIIPGTAAALYGMNAINGLANIRTKNPFSYQGLSVMQQTGVNHLNDKYNLSPQVFSTTNLRYAKVLHPKVAFKINLSYTNGRDWFADNRTDLSSKINSSVGLIGLNNPALNEVNSYGNESSNSRTLLLNGKNYVVARTGYREIDIDNYDVENFKGDMGVYFRPKKGHEINLVYKGAAINTIYQRSNRFRLDNYLLHQFSLDYHAKFIELKSYFTLENTGKSYNIRSLAENMDRTFKDDNSWFADYSMAYNNAITNGLVDGAAHQQARLEADAGRLQPGTEIWNQKKNELTSINNWDIGAALRVKAVLVHNEGILHWHHFFPVFFSKINSTLLMGFDQRTYTIIPDGNYFINPVDENKNLIYTKAGSFIHLKTNFAQNKILVGLTLRADKSTYFKWKFNPRFTLVYSPINQINLRASYQSGYRFPSIFEGFSNVNSGGVKRVGGLPIMSQGIFENSYTKASIEEFVAQVNYDVNVLGITQNQAIEKNKGSLQKNPYTYLQPEYVKSFEIGFRGLALKNSLFVDADFHYNSYENFIAQVEASVPNTTVLDSIPYSLYSKSTQSRYRLWTNSQSKIYNYGFSLGLKYKLNAVFSAQGNFTLNKLDKTEDQDGLEDGFNMPAAMINGSLIAENFWKKLSVGCTSRYQSKYDYVSFLVSGEVPAYWSFDAQINYFFAKPNVTVKIGATNIFNKPFYTYLGGPQIGSLYYCNVLVEIK